MNSSHLQSSDPTDEEIALRAYRIWLQEGCPNGHDREHWLKAKKELAASKAAEKAAADRLSEQP